MTRARRRAGESCRQADLRCKHARRRRAHRHGRRRGARFLRATKNEAEISSILDSAYEHGECLVDGHLLAYDGRDFWIELYDWGGVDPYDFDGLDFGSVGETTV